MRGGKASTDPSLDGSGKEEKKEGEKGKVQAVAGLEGIGAGLVRASRPGNQPPTDTDSNALAPVTGDGATLSYLDSWPA